MTFWKNVYEVSLSVRHNLHNIIDNKERCKCSAQGIHRTNLTSLAIEREASSKRGKLGREPEYNQVVDVKCTCICVLVHLCIY